MLPPVLKTHRYILSPYRKEDEARYLEMVLDDEVIRFMGGVTGNAEEEKGRFKKIFDIYEQDNKKWFWIWGIYRNGILCAHLELKETEHTGLDELEIVYMVHPNERREGLMSEVMRFLKIAHPHWQKTIIATISPQNLVSAALLEKWGVDKKELQYEDETGDVYYKLTLKNS